MQLAYTFTVPAPLDHVATALCSEALHTAAELDRDEVVSSRLVLLEEHEGRRVFEIRSTEYRRTKLGRIDRSATVDAVTRNTYDPRANTLAWVYEGVGSRWVTARGVYQLTPVDEGTRVLHDVTIEVNVPLVGGKIAKIIAKEFDQAAKRFERLLRQKTASTSSGESN